MIRLAINNILIHTRKFPAILLSRSGTTIAGEVDHNELENYADMKYEEYFNRPDIDGWELRRAMNEILGMDMVPYPTTVIAGMKACRRVNDYALAVRWLEGVKFKTGDKKNEIWPYMIHEIRPCLDELGINPPEELCYHRPELALQTVYDMKC